jgi:flagellar motor switch protein FliM
MDGDQMGSQSAALLRRKIGAAQPRADPLLMTPEMALSTALARVTEKAMQLPIKVVTQSLAKVSAAEIVEILPDHALLAMTEGPKKGLGLVALDAGALSVLTEMLTIGRMSTLPPTVARRPTRTDAAMLAGIIDGMLVGFEVILAEHEAAAWAAGFRYASHLADARPLGLMLDESAYQAIRLTVEFGEAGGSRAEVRVGTVIAVYPAKGRGPAAMGRSGPEVGDGATAPTSANRPAGVSDEGMRIWADAMEDVVLKAPTAIDAVLGRITLPLAEVLKLEQGASLTLPATSLANVQVEGSNGSVFWIGQLGQGSGRRAIRLVERDPGTKPLMAQTATASEVVPASDQPLVRKSPTKPQKPNAAEDWIPPERARAGIERPAEGGVSGAETQNNEPDQSDPTREGGEPIIAQRKAAVGQ